MRKIAFCFMTYDNLNHLDLWEKFFAQASPDQYAIYVHANNRKFVSQEILKNNLIPENIYGLRHDFIDYVRCFLKTFQFSFEDSNVYKAINLTQSCIPIQSFQKVYKELTKHDKGILDWFNAAQYSNQVFLHRYYSLRDLNFISKEDWVAHAGHGIVFSKEMVDFFAIHDNTHLFESMEGQDEHYIGNNLLHYNRENLIERKHVHRNHFTGGGAQGGLHSLSEEFIRQLRASGALFLRKLAPGAHIPKMCIEESSIS